MLGRDVFGDSMERRINYSDPLLFPIGACEFCLKTNLQIYKNIHFSNQFIPVFVTFLTCKTPNKSWVLLMHKARISQKNKEKTTFVLVGHWCTFESVKAALEVCFYINKQKIAIRFFWKENGKTRSNLLHQACVALAESHKTDIKKRLKLCLFIKPINPTKGPTGKTGAFKTFNWNRKHACFSLDSYNMLQLNVFTWRSFCMFELFQTQRISSLSTLNVQTEVKQWWRSTAGALWWSAGYFRRTVLISPCIRLIAWAEYGVSENVKCKTPAKQAHCRICATLKAFM